MDEEELSDLVDCVDCGATISPGPDRAFALGEGRFLCFACAGRRGGAYDIEEDRWTSAPDVADAPDERRPHF
jgi:recombinational DNA repair protein (RecF pathway)